jgi:hypothetical protein
MARFFIVTTALLGFTGACSKSDTKQKSSDESKPSTSVGSAGSAGSAEAAPATSPACAAKVKELEPWLAQLGIETASHEIEMGGTLPTIDRAAVPLSRVSDWLLIGSSLSAYDATVRSVAGTDKPLARTAKAITDRLTQMHSTPTPSEERGAAPTDQLRINVDEKTPWKDVVLVVDAAAKAGYTEALFAFGAKSKMTAPAGAEATTTSADAASQASKALEALREKCKAWDRAVLRHTFNPDRAENAKAVARETAAALAECNCAADVDEVKKLTWQSERWHQARLRTRVVVKLAGEGATTIALPAKTPWSAAHAKLVEAAPEGAPPPAVKLVVK